MKFTIVRTAQAIAVGAMAVAMPLTADAETTLRFQTVHGQGSVQGKALVRFAERVGEMTDGELQIEMFTDSAVVKSTESFEAAATGILDGEATAGTYITGKNPAFQFFGDLLGGYDDPNQILGWFKNGGGREIANELYPQHNMHLIGVYSAQPESLVSTTELAGIEDLEGWKFRSPPGMQSEIFGKLGAAPVVMAFGEIFSAMTTGTVSGADANILAVNEGLGVHDVAKHATYPGFHSMLIETVAINLDKWNALTEAQQAIMESALDTLAIEVATQAKIDNNKAAERLREQGVTLHEWSEEDRAKYRLAAREVWEEWATRTPEAKAAYESHLSYMKDLGILAD